MEATSGAVIGADGTIYVAGRTASALDPASLFISKSAFIAKLTADGSDASCTFRFVSITENFVMPIALSGNGSVLIAGYSPYFPRGTTPPQPGQDPYAFLARVDPCEQTPRFSAYLPLDTRPSAIAVGNDGAIYVGASDASAPDTGILLRLDANGASVLSQVRLRGVPAAIAIDAAGDVYATGQLPQTSQTSIFVRPGFVARFSADLQKTVYDLTLGDGGWEVGLALAAHSDGSVFVAGAAAQPNSDLFSTAAMLTRVMPDGAIAFHKVVESADPTTAGVGGFRKPVGLGFGPDGRLWMAIGGPAGFPRTMSADQRTLLNGVLLRGFDTDGNPAGGDTMIPGGAPAAPLPAAVISNGSIATLTVNPYFPVTPGSADSGVADSVSVVSFDLTSVDAAPSVVADREILEMDDVSLIGTSMRIRNPKTIGVRMSDDSAPGYVANVVLGGDGGAPPPPPAFATDDTRGVLPAEISVRAVQNPAGTAAAAALIPGAQGLIAIPVRLRTRNVALFTSVLDSVDLPGPSTKPFMARIAVSIAEAIGGAMQVSLPFAVTHTTPWLKLLSAEGTTPAEIQAQIDPTGLGPGTYSAELDFDFGNGAVMQRSISFTIGPVLRVLPAGWQIAIPYGQPYTHTIMLQSSSSPVDFTLESGNPFLDVSPKTGTTPQEITVSVNPAGFATGSKLFASIGASTPFGRYAVTGAYTVVSPLPDQRDQIASPAAPGSLITYLAGTSRCDDDRATGIPWPLSLGSCTLRVNGRPMPLGSITNSAGNYPNIILPPVASIVAQLPYDLDGSIANVEIEDRKGNKTVAPLRLAPVSPVVKAVVGGSFAFAIKRLPGQEVVFKLTGLGATDSPAPWGDVSSGGIHSLAAIQAYVGGRAARVLSAELSTTEVGIFEVHVEVPSLAPDLYSMNLRIAGSDIPVGGVVITSQ